MIRLIKLASIVVLVGLYATVVAAVFHPHVSPEYRAFFIDRTSTDYSPAHYDVPPEEGMTFKRPGLPQWVSGTHGLSLRDDWGRWTDGDLGSTAGLTFNRSFDGALCVDFTVRAIPWMVGQSVIVRMDHQKQPVKINSEDPNEYRLTFTDLHGADGLDFVLPEHLPQVIERAHDSSDPRRLGINIANVKLLPGECSVSGDNHAQ